jgi:hypothetical protein
VTEIQEYDAWIIRMFPSIEWHTPIHIKILDGMDGWGCRLCIARLGLKAKEPQGRVFNSLTDWQAHQEDAQHLRRTP